MATITMKKGIITIANKYTFNINEGVFSSIGENPIDEKHICTAMNLVQDTWGNNEYYMANNRPFDYDINITAIQEPAIIEWCIQKIMSAISQIKVDKGLLLTFAESVKAWEAIYNVHKSYGYTYASSLAYTFAREPGVTVSEFIKYCLPMIKDITQDEPNCLINNYLFSVWYEKLNVKNITQLQKDNEIRFLYDEVIYYRRYMDYIPIKFHTVYINHLYNDIIPFCTNPVTNEICWSMVRNSYSNYIEAVHILNLETPPKTNNFLKYITDIIKMAISIKEKENSAKCIELYNKYYKCEDIISEHYQVVIPHILDDIKNESIHQNNCLFNSYLEDYISNKYIIVFIRDKNNVTIPFLTMGLEIYNNSVHIEQVQAKNNQSPRLVIPTEYMEEYDKLLIKIQEFFQNLLTK